MSTSDLEERIGRVMSDLREETTIPDQYGSPSPVSQRMAQTLHTGAERGRDR
jgi:hypothetical protein